MRAVTSLQLLCDVARESGIDPSQCLSNTGIDYSDLSRVDFRFSTEQEVQAIRNLIQIAPKTHGLGALVGKRMHVNAFGIWGFAILTSPTLRAAIRTSLDYVQLSFVIAEHGLMENGDGARLEFDMRGLPTETHRYLLERHSVVAMTFITELIQKPGFRDFVFETPDDDPEYEEAISDLLGIQVRGGRPHHALAFPADLLDRPLPKSDPVTLRFCLDQCEALMEQADSQSAPWSRKVRDAIFDDMGSEQSIEDIAAKLSLTERTLRRRLTEERTSFRDLYTDARMSLAHELLATAGLNVETVAWRVGYSEPASFVRAFSKRYGKTPGEVRRKKALRDSA